LVIPCESCVSKNGNEHIKQGIAEIKEKARSLNHEDSRFLIGIGILLFGFALLLGNFGFWSFFNLGKLWPVILILVGFLLLSHRNERE